MLLLPRTGDAAPPGVRGLRAPGPEVWIVVGITALAAMLRFWTLTAQSFWVDEATTVHEVGLSLGAMLHSIRVDETTPPLFFVLAWVWCKVFGAGEFGIRSLSALAGVATVPVIYLCGRELVSRAAGVVAAALAAVSPFLIWYSQEARSYALLGLFAALTVLFCARAVRTGSRRALWLWALCSVLAVLTHFFAGFLIAPEALWLLWLLSRPGWAAGRGAAVGALAVVAAAQLAVLPLAIGDTSHPLNWILGFPLSLRIRSIPVDFAVSQLYKGSAGRYGLAGAAVLAAVCAVLLAWGGLPRRERRGALLAAGLAAATLLVPIALAVLGSDYVLSRNFLPAWIPLALVVGAACTAPRGRLAQVAGGALGMVLALGFVWAGLRIQDTPAYQRPDWRAVAAALGRTAGRRAIVAYDGNFAEQPLAVYLPRAQFTYSGVPANVLVSVSEIDVVGVPAQAVPAHLPPGVRLLGVRQVAGDLVARFALSPAWRLTPTGLASRAPELLAPTPAGEPAVLIQGGNP